jgi:hypothetical protein
MTTWRKSSRSTETSSCVEIAGNLGAVRDSKNAAGPVLTVSVRALVGVLKDGKLIP